MMPGMDGETMGKAIKADPNLNKTLLVMLTSMGQRGDAARITDIGFSAYLTKPIRRSDLFDCLSTLLNNSKDQQLTPSEPKLITRHTIQEEKKQSLSILLAEDNETNKILALHLVEKFGYHVDAVETGKAAVEALKKKDYDLVLMDIQMPEMDGLEATRRIRSPKTGVLNQEIPIIALTAHAMKGDRDICLKAGMDDYVSKPIDPDLLLQAINRLIHRTPVKPIETGGQSEKPDEPASCVIYNHEELLKRVGGDEDLSRELLEMFLQEFPQKLNDIKQALKEDDAPMVARVAHTIKGSSANIGADRIREAALDMEIASKELNLNLANTLVEKIQSEFEKLHTVLSETMVLP
jgi:CheY-like chemotaxis protein/HPt (histidine-containing phosphotransfer) domain-containing protein